MDNENQVIGNINSVSDENNIGIQSTSSPFVTTFYFQDYYDDKLVNKFIKTVEKLIRTSREYKTYIEELRTNVYALNHDSIMSNITTADVDLEFHHYPLTLFEIVEVCMLQHINDGKQFTSFSLAKEIMEEHFKHHIGIVPLSHTMHELAHSGNLFISKKQIFGDYQKFISEHPNGVPNDVKTKITTMEKYSDAGVPSDFKGLLL